MGKNIWETGKVVKWMVRANSYGLMVGDMRVAIKKIKKRDLVYLNGKLCNVKFLGQMGGNILVIGKMENNMGKNLHLVYQKRENGLMEIELDGLKI
jgi:hypothetical protein